MSGVKRTRVLFQKSFSSLIRVIVDDPFAYSCTPLRKVREVWQFVEFCSVLSARRVLTVSRHLFLSEQPSCLCTQPAHPSKMLNCLWNSVE